MLTTLKEDFSRLPRAAGARGAAAGRGGGAAAGRGAAGLDAARAPRARARRRPPAARGLTLARRRRGRPASGAAVANPPLVAAEPATHGRCRRPTDGAAVGRLGAGDARADARRSRRRPARRTGAARPLLDDRAHPRLAGPDAEARACAGRPAAPAGADHAWRATSAPARRRSSARCCAPAACAARSPVPRSRSRRATTGVTGSSCTTSTCTDSAAAPTRNCSPGTTTWDRMPSRSSSGRRQAATPCRRPSLRIELEHRTRTSRAARLSGEPALEAGVTAAMSRRRRRGAGEVRVVILALETATTACSAALCAADGSVVAERLALDGPAHSLAAAALRGRGPPRGRRRLGRRRDRRRRSRPGRVHRAPHRHRHSAGAGAGGRTRQHWPECRRSRRWRSPSPTRPRRRPDGGWCR